MTRSNFIGFIRKSCLLLLLLPVMICFSCNPAVVYEKNEPIPGNIWNRHNIQVFEVDVDDTVSAYDLLINIRNTGEYPRSNLFLFISATSPGGSFTRDTMELALADASGRWLGRGFGSVWQNRFFYRRNIRFPEKGIYRFEIEQAMRIEELPGILDVGLRVEKTQF